MSALGRLKRINAAEDFAFKLRLKVFAERLRIAQENHSPAFEFKAANGLGEIKARIGPYEYLLAKIEYGWHCWRDPNFLPAYLRDNPEIRVKTTRGTRGQEYAGTRFANLPHPAVVVPPSYADAAADAHAAAIADTYSDATAHVDANADPNAYRYADAIADAKTDFNALTNPDAHSDGDPDTDTYSYSNVIAFPDAHAAADAKPDAHADSDAIANTEPVSVSNS